MPDQRKGKRGQRFKIQNSISQKSLAMTVAGTLVDKDAAGS